MPLDQGKKIKLSVELESSLVDKIDRLKEEWGFSRRSETISHIIENLFNEKIQPQKGHQTTHLEL